MKHLWRKLLPCMLALLLTLTTVAAAVAESYGFINGTDTLNLRADGSSTSAWLGTYSKGTWLSISGSRNNFYYVRTPDGKTGYMSKNYISTLDNLQWGNVAIVANQKSTAFLNLRSTPSYSASVITILYNGVPLPILGTENGWYRVQFMGQVGYVRSEYVSVGYQVLGTTVGTIKSPNNSAVNLRSGPGSAYAVIRQFSGDRYVSVVYKGTGWWYVAIDGYSGFMSADYLTEGLHAARDGASPSGQSYALVNNPGSTSYLNLRAQPSTTSKVTAQLTNGMQLTMIKQGTEWSEVYVDAYGAIGYVMTRYLRLVNLPSTPTKTVAHPQGSYVNLRSSASMTSSVVARINSRQKVTIVAPGDSWTRVSYNGRTGYIMSYFLAD